jgi:hypothetical protein
MEERRQGLSHNTLVQVFPAAVLFPIGERLGQAKLENKTGRNKFL